MRSISTAVAVVAVVAAGGCKTLGSPDLNAVSINDLSANPTAASLGTAVQGLFRLIRDNFPEIVIGGEIGREGFDLDPSNAQFQSEIYVTQDPNLGFNWYYYRPEVIASVILNAVGKVPSYKAADVAGVTGFVQTIEALCYLYTIQGLDQSGAAIQVTLDPTAPPPPIASRAQVYQQITTLLQQAQTNLQAAGATFPFSLIDGFANFNTPATFLTFNRAVKARSDLYQASYGLNGVTFNDVLTDLTGSFLDTTQPLSMGAYWTYSTNSGDQPNTLYDPTGRQYFANPILKTDAQLKPDATPDLRWQTKTAPIDTVTRTAFTVTERFNVYTSPSAPTVAIKNEELILMRSEALLKTGNRAGALADVNLIRTTSGGLAPLAADPGLGGTQTGDRLIDEILYNRRYSLLWEGGFRWVDLRRYGLLAQLPKQRPGDITIPYLSLPADDCAVRSPKPAGCTVPTPF